MSTNVLTVAQVIHLVDFIDDLYAEQAVDQEPRLALFYAHSRLDGAYGHGDFVRCL